MRTAGLLVMMFFGAIGCGGMSSPPHPKIILFNGAGTSPNSVKAVGEILIRLRLPYVTLDSQDLNQLKPSEFESFRLVIVPGGNYIEMGNSLSPNTTAAIREAVHGGLNYLGICAGGLLAGNADCNSLNLTSGVKFGFYADVNRNIHKAVVRVSFVDEPTQEFYWEDGPQFEGWGDVVGKYADGTPAVVQGRSMKGKALLVGVHPEAPDNWRNGMVFETPTQVNNAFAARLISSALEGSELPHY
ncbi:MAG: hypothetical protein IPK72_24895 [Candidatus Eisenbacteria bacterium]|nr:hypothetical protein [Candidatus Eisenbacteria bacterium]